MGIDEMYAVTVSNHSLYGSIDHALKTPIFSLALTTAGALHQRFDKQRIEVWKQKSSAQWELLGEMVDGCWRQYIPISE